ncbi:MAG: MFS transporter [Rikenellaceae bacterium]
MDKENRWALAPFMMLTFIYFIVGFITTINGQLQGPLQVSFLSQTTDLRNTLTTLISFSFFLGYLINSSLGGRWVDTLGYKSTMLRGLGFMVSGVATYALSAWLVTNWSGGIFIGDNFVPVGYLLFLLGSFQTGTSAAILQVVVNPYIASYQLRGTNAVQRMNINGAINSLGTTIAPLFVTGVMFAGVHFASVTSEQLITPLIVIAAAIAVVTLVTSRLSLPDIASTRNQGGSKAERSIWSFRHLRLGVVAIFFYVGAEVAIGVNVNLHAMEMIEQGEKLTLFGHEGFILAGLDLGIPALLASLYWGGLMVGRLIFSLFNNISPKILLASVAVGAIILTLAAIASNNLWVLISVGLCHSVMWGATFTLAVEGLGEYTSKASGVFMMGVFGGAIFSLLQGGLADILGGWRWSWFMVVICEGVLLYYALWGSKIVENGD